MNKESTELETWTDQYLISSYEVDPLNKIPIYSLGKFMQETAYNHAKSLGFGYEDLKDGSLFWVLARLVIKMKRYPTWRERIHIRTWPSGVEGLMAFRDFEILDAEQKHIGSAGSSWLILDSEKRRPQRMTALKEKIHLFPEPNDFHEQPVKLPPLTNPVASPPFPVRYSDLDLYNHVNNAKYMQWLLDSYDTKLLRENEISKCEISFLSETVLEDEVYIETETVEPSETAPVFIHCIKRKSDDRPVCQARITWNPQIIKD